MITLEQVDQLRKRTNCSYEEAKALLEKHNGDVLEAIVDFEKSRNSKSYSNNIGDNGYNGHNENHGRRSGEEFWKKTVELIQKGFENKVVIEDNHNVFLNISVNIMLLLVIIIPYITVPIIMLLLILGYKVSIKKTAGNEVNISSMVKDVADRFTGRNQPQGPQPPMTQDNTNPETKNDDYDEMTIE